MTSAIEIPYAVHMVADVDGNEDPAPSAWLSTMPRRRFTSRRDLGRFGWLAVAKRSLRWLRALPGSAALLLALVALACSDSSDPARPIEQVASVSVTPAEATLTLGGSLTLQAVLRDASGRPLEGRSIAWTTSSAALATVTPNGTVTAVSAGAVSVSATSEGKTGRAQITLLRAPVASVALTPPISSIQPGQAVQLSAVVRDAAGNELSDRVITWSTTTPEVATVSESGLVIGNAPGEATVTATIEGKNAGAAIRVTAIGGNVDRVELDVTTLTLEEGGTQQLTAIARNADGSVVTGRVTHWTSSDPGVATVAANGDVVAVRAGTAAIRARIDGKTAEATANVTNRLAFDLVFDASEPLVRPEIYAQDLRDPQAAARRVFTSGRWASDPMPSPDGRKVAVTVTNDAGDRDLYIVFLDAPGFTRLTSGSADDDQPAWSHDGRRIAFRRFTEENGADVWVVDVESAIATNLTADQGATVQGSPTWSPDGARIAYSHSSSGGAHVWTMRADGSDKRQVTVGNVYDDQPAWSPDGTTIAYQRSAAGIFGDLYLVNAGGGNERRLMPFVDLAFGQFAPAWSPDGRLIAFSSKHEDGVYQIYTVWADGSKVARRTTGELNKENPAWIRREVIAAFRR